MMNTVDIRNVDKMNKCIEAIIYFYSRIVLKKIDVESIVLYRKIEKAYKNTIKLNADLRYLYINMHNNACINCIYNYMHERNLKYI